MRVIRSMPKPVKKSKKAKRFIKSRSASYGKQLENKADEIVKKIVLLRDGFCVCPAPEKGHSRIRQPGHLIKRGKKGVKWDLYNVNEQCSSCNRRHNDWANFYEAWFVDKFGRDERLRLERDAATYKISIEDLETLVSELAEIYKLQQIDASLKPRFTQEQILTGEWRTVNGLRLMTSYPVDREMKVGAA